MNSSHSETELYKRLKEAYPNILIENGVYIIPAFGYEFRVREMGGEINLIYKGRIIKTYQIDESAVEKVSTILGECIFIFDDEEWEMFTFIGLAHVVWYARNPFLSGELYIGEGIHVEDPWEESEYIDRHLSAREMCDELFKRRPDLPFISFKYEKRSFIYINTSTKKDK